MLNAFSVDVEDYFQVNAFERAIPRDSWGSFEPRVERNTRRLLELCDEYGVRGTFFTLGWVAERWPDLVREIRDAGHELATHGQDHRRVTSMTPEQFREDVRRSKRTIEDVAGVEVIGYRAPSYSIVRETMWAVDVLAEEGFLYDSSIFPIRHDRYGIPDFPRFPRPVRGGHGSDPAGVSDLHDPRRRHQPAVHRRRLPAPLPDVRSSAGGCAGSTSVERRPAVVYIHPWEIDPGAAGAAGRRDDPPAPLPQPRPHRGAAGPALLRVRLHDLPGDSGL